MRTSIFLVSTTLFSLGVACSSDDDGGGPPPATGGTDAGTGGASGDGGAGATGGSSASGGSGGSGNAGGGAGQAGDGGAAGDAGAGGAAGGAGTAGVSGDAGAAGAAGAGGLGGAAGGGSDPEPDPSALEPCDDAVFPDPVTTLPVAPTRLVAASVAPSDVTSDGHVVYRQGNTLMAVRAEAGATPVEVLSGSGTVAVKGPVVFYWTSPDYEAGTGQLSIWTGSSCSRTVGTTLLAEDLVVVSPDGSRLLYPINVTDQSFDLVVANRDFTGRHVLVRGIGRASEETCRPLYGFAGAQVVVGHCAPGTREASLEVFSRSGDDYAGQLLSASAQPLWSADATGTGIAYLGSDYDVYYFDGTDHILVDHSANWVQLGEDGSTLFYAVGDQLRRTNLADLLVIPVVTRQARVINEWSPTFDHVLYSSTVIYEGGERRDLFLTPTATFNPTPTQLSDVSARLSRHAFTDAGNHVAYLTEVSETTGAGTLHVVPVAGGDERVFDAVDTVAAAFDDILVFSDNRSDPEIFPVVADLKLLDASSAEEPQTIQASIRDGRSFRVLPGGGAVVYARPGDVDAEGIWLHPLVTGAP